MSREQQACEPASSSAENLISHSDSSPELPGSSGYLNPACSDTIPSSPPPTYQHVLEETRLAARNQTSDDKTPNKSRRQIIKQSSVDSISQESNQNSSSPNPTKLNRRSNTLSSDDSLNSIAEGLSSKERKKAEKKLKKAKKALEKKIPVVPENLTSNNQSETSLWQDYQEPSTSYDASSRQFDESSVTTLAMSQYERESEDEADMYETVNESDLLDEEQYCRLREQSDDIIEVVANKTSKEMYLAMAKELGIQCRMSDQCRCLDCQGGYLESGDGDTGDENGKTDGGLGAGTPMFVSEVFGHGIAPACTIL